MLVIGLVLTAVFLLTAIFAPLHGALRLCPAQRRRRSLPRPGSHRAGNIWGTTVGGYDVLSRVIWGAQTAAVVIVVAVVMSIFLGVALGLVSGYFGGWLDRIWW